MRKTNWMRIIVIVVIGTMLLSLLISGIGIFFM